MRTTFAVGPQARGAAASSAKLLIIGQASGTKVHATGIPWNDPSGDRLRDWLGLDREVFYNETKIAIIPMGFCYPGKGKSGDLPPRPECAQQWHRQLLSQLPAVELRGIAGRSSIKKGRVLRRSPFVTKVNWSCILNP